MVFALSVPVRRRSPIRGFRSAGFTLVELLVVLGIITVLVGILLPTIGAIREKSRKTVCLSNLRSLGQAMFLYANEHKGRLPNANPVGMWESFPDQSRVLIQFGQKYVQGAGVFHCPSDQDPVPQQILTGYYNQPDSARTSYEFYSVWWAPEYGPILSKLQRQKPHTSRMFAPLAWDQYGGRKHPWRNHRGGGNVVFADGHAEWQDEKDWETSTTRPDLNGGMPDPADDFWPLEDDILP